MGQPSKESKQRWLDANKEKRPTICRNWKLRRFYGISPEEYDAMLLQQDNRCAICKREFEESPHLDHDHDSGWVRGLLCGSCNHAIGLFQEDIVRIQESIEYLIANVPPPEFNLFMAREQLKKKPSYSAKRKENLRLQMTGNNFRGGIPAWNKGKSWDEETREKMSESAKKRIRNETEAQKEQRNINLTAGRTSDAAKEKWKVRRGFEQH